MKDSSDPVSSAVNTASKQGLVKPGKLPVVMIPSDQPINVPTVSEVSNDGADEGQPAHEVILVTPQGDVVPVMEPDIRTINSTSDRSAPVSFDEEWLNNALAGSHPLIRYDNRHPENIEGSINQQMMGIDETQRQAIIRTFGEDIPVTAAAEMLRRSQGEFGRSTRLRQISSGMIVNANDNVYNPITQRSLDIINETTARINMHTEAMNQTDSLFERYLNDEEGYVNFLRDNFSTFSEETRRQHSRSIASLREDLVRMNRMFEQVTENGGSAEENDRLLEMEAIISRRIATLEDQLDHDDNKTRLKLSAMEAYQKYKRRRMNPEIDMVNIENNNLEQLYQFLTRLNDTQVDVMRSIINAESNMSPEQARRMADARKELYKTEFIRNRCATIVTFLQEMANNLAESNGIRSPEVVNEIRQAVLNIIERYSGMNDFIPGRMAREVTEELANIYIKHAGQNFKLKKKYAELVAGVSAFNQAYQYLEEIINADDMTTVEIYNNIKKFHSVLAEVPGGEFISQSLGRDYLRNSLRIQEQNEGKIKERLLNLSRQLNAISSEEFERYQQIMESRRRGESSSGLGSSANAEELERSEAEVRNLTELLNQSNQKIEDMKKNLKFISNYKKLKEICNEMITEISALNLLTTNTEEVVNGSTATRAKAAIRTLNQIKTYIENGQHVQAAATNEGLQEIIEQLHKDIEALQQGKDELWEEITQASTNIVQLQNDKKQLYEQNEELKGALAEAQELLATSTQNLANANTANQSLTEQLETVRGQLQILIDEHGPLMEQANRLQSALNDAVNRINNSEKLLSESLEREKHKDETLNIAANTITELRGENEEMLSRYTATSRNLQQLVNRNIDLLNATARAFTESAVGYYNSQAGNTMRTNPALISYESLRFYLSSNQALDIMAAQFRRSNGADPTTDLGLYLLAKRFSQAYRARTNSNDASEEIELFMKLASSVLTYEEAGPMNIISLNRALGIENELDYMSDQYWQMFDTAVQMSPEVINNFRIMSSMAMLVDFVNEPHAFHDGVGTDGRLSGLVRNVLNSGSVSGNGIRVMLDGVAMRVAKEYMKFRRRIEGRQLPEMLDENEDEVIAEYNAAEYEEAMTYFRAAREFAYLDYAATYSGQASTLPELFGGEVSEERLMRYIFSNEAYESIYSRMNNLSSTQLTNSPEVQEAIRIYLGLDNDIIDDLFSTRFAGRDNDSFNSVYLGIIQAYIERFNTASRTTTNTLSSALQAPRIASRGLLIPTNPTEETRELPTADPDID